MSQPGTVISKNGLPKLEYELDHILYGDCVKQSGSLEILGILAITIVDLELVIPPFLYRGMTNEISIRKMERWRSTLLHRN